MVPQERFPNPNRFLNKVTQVAVKTEGILLVPNDIPYGYAVAQAILDALIIYILLPEAKQGKIGHIIGTALGLCATRFIRWVDSNRLK